MKQLNLFGEEVSYAEGAEKVLNNATIIKNISYDSTEILHNIGVLYNNGSDQFDADMTASTLGFYGAGRGRYEIPVPRLLFDVYPLRKDIIKIDKWGGGITAKRRLNPLTCLRFAICDLSRESPLKEQSGCESYSQPICGLLSGGQPISIVLSLAIRGEQGVGGRRVIDIQVADSHQRWDTTQYRGVRFYGRAEIESAARR